MSRVGGSSVESDEDVECALIYRTVPSQYFTITPRMQAELNDIRIGNSIEAETKSATTGTSCNFVKMMYQDDIAEK